MDLPRDLQLYIMSFVILCEKCDKCMIQNKSFMLEKEDNHKHCPFTYWDCYEGKPHIICKACYWNDLKIPGFD